MSKFLAIGLLALLCGSTVGAIECSNCGNVAEDNTCTVKPEPTCDYGLFNVCYTRVIKKGGAITQVIRGCILLCKNRKRKKGDYEEIMICCEPRMCNTHNVFTNQ